jgi:hypothetical protein
MYGFIAPSQIDQGAHLELKLFTSGVRAIAET